jgi:hypothetical protein
LETGEVSPFVMGGLALVWRLVGANLVSILVDRQRRSLYDLVAGTRVIVPAR